MKHFNKIKWLTAVSLLVFLVACQSPVTLTSWKNPASNAQMSKVAVMAFLDKLEYIKPFEQAMDAYFNANGLKAIGSLDFLNPTGKYTVEQIKTMVDSLGCDAVLVFKYKGTDQTQNYVPPTYTGGWGWGYGGGYWGGGYWGGGTVTGGYWTTTSVVNLSATLYIKDNPQAVWTGDITVTNPTSTYESAMTIAQDCYADFLKNNLLKNPNPKPVTPQQ